MANGLTGESILAFWHEALRVKTMIQIKPPKGCLLKSECSQDALEE